MTKYRLTKVIEPESNQVFGPSYHRQDTQRTEAHVELRHGCAASNTQIVGNQAKWYESSIR